MSLTLEHVLHMAAQRAYHELDLLVSLLPREVTTHPALSRCAALTYNERVSLACIAQIPELVEAALSGANQGDVLSSVAMLN